MTRDAHARLHAQFALASASRRVSGECPSDAALAVFVEGRTRGRARRDMLAHLNECPDCYQTALLDAAGPAQVAPHSPGLVRRTLDRLRRGRLSTSIDVAQTSMPWLVGIPAGAIALVVVLVWPRPVQLESEITAQYRLLLDTSPAIADALDNAPIPWDNAALGFASASDSAAQAAVLAGLWEGRRNLLGQAAATAVPVTEPAATRPEFYELGRWLALLWATSSVTQVEVDAGELLALAKALTARVTDQAPAGPERDATIDALEAIGRTLGSAPDGRLSARTRRQLAGQVDALVARLTLPR